MSTDNLFILLVLNPLDLDYYLGRRIINKLQQCGLFISLFSYVIENIYM